MASLPAAIKLAEAKTTEICVCEGKYEFDSGVVLDKAVSVRGGFSCSSWQRLGGAMSGTLDNKTELSAANPDNKAEGSVFYVVGSAIQPSTVSPQR